MLEEIPAIIALIVSIAALLASLRKDRSDVFLECAKRYMRLADLRMSAIEEKDPAKARKYFFQILNLAWLEYELYRSGMLSKKVFQSWMKSRQKAYELDFKITCEDTAKKNDKLISFRDMWEEWLKKHRIEEKDFIKSITGKQNL